MRVRQLVSKVKVKNSTSTIRSFFFSKFRGVPHVMSSFSKLHHHRRRILSWAQVSPSKPYIRGENVPETCESLLDKDYVEGSRRPWRSPHMCRRM